MVVAPETVDGGKGSVELRDDGVVHLKWLSGITIEVEDARAAMAKVNDVCQGVPRPMLVDMAAVASVSREARGVWSIPCDASRIALLGRSPVDRVLANFFLECIYLPAPPGSSHPAARRRTGSMPSGRRRDLPRGRRSTAHGMSLRQPAVRDA